MTEEEAKTRWCPFARVDSTGINRPNPGPNADTNAGWPPCIGSACMAFRSLPERRAVLAHAEDVSIFFAEEAWCGLVGKP